MKTKHHGQMSESFLTAVFLSLSGGLQDAYTYLFRGKVFANAQTGNIVLLSANIMDGQWDRVLHYLVPLCAFALGVLVAEKMRECFRDMQRLHWRQLVVLGEGLLMFLVGFLPPEQRHIFRGNTALGPCPAGAQAALRQAGCGGAHHRFHTGKGHDARPGAQCALCGQQCSAPVECAARHGQHTAKGALMAVPRAAGDILPDKFFGNFNSHHSTSGRTI